MDTTTNRKKVWYAPNKKEAYGQEEIDAVVDSLKNSILAGFGEKTIEFEKRIAERFGKKHGIFVNSGSSANLLALACLDLIKGSEVITPACTFSTTVAPIIQLGLKPIFCDVELDTYVPSVKQILDKVTPKTRVIMIPNLVGNKMDWKSLRESLEKENRDDIILIEDSCDTITHTYDSDISTTSFYASHVITAMGSGGMLMVNTERYKKRALQYRDWGRLGDNNEDMSDRFNHKVDGIPYDYKFLYGVLGYNFKSSEANAAFGLVQLNKLDNLKRIRRANYNRYFENLKDVKELVLPRENGERNWLAMPFQLNSKYTDRNRVDLLEFLENKNIQTRVLFSGNITRHPIYRKYFEFFENSDYIMEYAFLLGAHHGMSLDDVDYVCNQLRKYFGYEEI